MPEEHSHSDHHHHHQHGSTHLDPVCNMKVMPETAAAQWEYEGTTYYFCNPGCKEKFSKAPLDYLNEEKKKEKAKTKQVDGAIYTCPMHPEIKKQGPGSCPICGMALEPEEPTGEESNEELIDMSRRFLVSLIFSLPLLVIAMGPMIPGLSSLVSALPADISKWVQLALATPVVVYSGWPFFQRGLDSLIARSLNMFTLISTGVGAAYIYSLVATVAPQLLPQSFFNTNGEAFLYYESAAVIIALVLLGQVIELKARENTGGAIKSLLTLVPEKAFRLKENEEIEEVPVEEIAKGDFLQIKPGSKIPVDGIIVSGESHIDESMLTGEPITVRKQKDDTVIGGTVNQQGSFVMKAEKVGDDTMLSKIVGLVKEAQRSRAPIQGLVDKVASVFVPLVFLASIITFIVWFNVNPQFALLNAVSVLIIACPCALGLATPVSIMVATGKGAKSGVLIKSGEALQRLQDVDVLLLDKTGTITEGKPSVSAIETIENINEKDLLALAASLEKSSEHPLARAIVNAAREKELELSTVSNFKYELGFGVSGEIDSKSVIVGTSKWLEKMEVDTKPLTEKSLAINEQGATAVFVAIDGIASGVIGIADKIKKDAKDSIGKLQGKGIKVIMVTGDTEKNARITANNVGIKEVESEVKPDEKHNVVTKFQDQGKVVAMAGDGINDAPALAKADIAIAMGTGVDIAIENAEIILVKGDIGGMVRAFNLSETMMANIKQNLFFAFGYNALGIPVAAGILYPIFSMLLNPMVSSAAMSLSSVSVILNSLRIKNARI